MDIFYCLFQELDCSYHLLKKYNFDQVKNAKRDLFSLRNRYKLEKFSLLKYENNIGIEIYLDKIN